MVTYPGAVSTNSAVQPSVSLDWSADAALIDGTAITIRPLRAGDEPALRLFFDALSP